jgi:hypothetical protein
MALTLSKTGIAQDQTINAWHVTQSVDALTGTAAYDITVSGSLVVSGSVTLSGATGSGYFTAAVRSNTSVISNIAANKDYTVPYLASTGSSTSALYYDTTGLSYNPNSDTLTAGNFEGTASLATTASFATTYTDPTFVDGPIYPSGSPAVPGSPLKMIVGASQTDGASTANVTVNELIGKTLNQNVFITATAEDNAGTSVSVDPAGPPPNLSFKSSNPNVNFHFHIFYV